MSLCYDNRDPGREFWEKESVIMGKGLKNPGSLFLVKTFPGIYCWIRLKKEVSEIHGYS